MNKKENHNRNVDVSGVALRTVKIVVYCRNRLKLFLSLGLDFNANILL